MVLAIDTATDLLGLALFDGRQILAELELPARMRHTVGLASSVSELLRSAGVSPADLKGIGIAQGPGSFTALRIGLAFAIGFSIPRNLPVFGIPTLDILVRAHPVIKHPLITVLRAGRGRIVWCLYAPVKHDWKAESGPQAGTWEELAAGAPRSACICGEIDRAGQAVLEKRRDLHTAAPHLNMRRAGVLAEMTAEKLRETKVRPGIPHLVYLRTIGITEGAGKRHERNS